MKYFVLFIISIITICGYSQDNEKKYNHFDEQGLRQGIWYSYFRDGGLRYQGQFVDDKPVGVFYYFFPEGGKRAEIIHDYEEKIEENAIKATFFYPNKQISSEGFYVNEERHGTWRFFNEKGQLVSENYYHHGENHGVWKIYYSHGRIAEKRTYHYGKKDGIWQRFYENGSVNVKANYTDDNLEGRFEVCFGNGNPRVVGLYRNNLPHGTWTFFTNRGEKEKVVKYNEGSIIEEEVYIESDESLEPIRPGDAPFTDEEEKRLRGF